jgi:hypothetical protein
MSIKLEKTITVRFAQEWTEFPLTLRVRGTKTTAIGLLMALHWTNTAKIQL